MSVPELWIKNIGRRATFTIPTNVSLETTLGVTAGRATKGHRLGVYITAYASVVYAKFAVSPSSGAGGVATVSSTDNDITIPIGTTYPNSPYPLLLDMGVDLVITSAGNVSVIELMS